MSHFQYSKSLRPFFPSPFKFAHADPATWSALHLLAIFSSLFKNQLKCHFFPEVFSDLSPDTTSLQKEALF